MLRKGHGDVYNVLKKEERRKRKAKRRERDQIAFIDLRFKRAYMVMCCKNQTNYIVNISRHNTSNEYE